MAKQREKQRRKNNRWFAVVLGSMLIMMAFVFSLRSLSSPYSTEAQQQETLTHQGIYQRISSTCERTTTRLAFCQVSLLGKPSLNLIGAIVRLPVNIRTCSVSKRLGTKKKSIWKQKNISMKNGSPSKETFESILSWEQSMDDHTALFVNGVDWNPALYANVITATNYIEAAHALQAAGYATDPTYADKIIHVIETYQLNQYDQ